MNVVRLLVAALALLGAGAVFAQEGLYSYWVRGDGAVIRVNNSTGRSLTVKAPLPAAAVADGAGGAGLRATQAVDVGATRVGVTLKRAVTVGNLARGAMLAARFSGPLVLAGLVYEGVRYADGAWLADDDGAPSGVTVLEHGLSDSYYTSCSVWGSSAPATATAETRDYVFVLSQFSGGSPPVAPWATVVNCKVGGTWYDVNYRPRLCDSGVDPSTLQCLVPAARPATDDELVISFQQGLIANPGKAPELVGLVGNSGAPGAADALAPGALSVEGPTQVQGPSTTTTKQTPSGTETTVSNTTYNITYQGDTIHIDASTVETTTHADGSVTTTTTTTTGSPSPAEETGPEAEEEGATVVDPELPPIPELYERKYPEGMVGVWNDKREGLEQSPFFQMIGKLAPSNLGDGGCPSWSLPLSLEGWAPYGSHTLQAPCWVWTALRSLMIIGALFVARRLIFGG